MNMTPEQWQRVKAFYEAARPLNEADRTALLDRECGDDKELREAVRQLLDAPQPPAEFLASPTPGSAGRLAMRFRADLN